MTLKSDWYEVDSRFIPSQAEAQAAQALHARSGATHLARKHVALYLYQIKGMSNEAVADYLNFNDPANFRRSFKRCTGSTPPLIQRLFNLE